MLIHSLRLENIKSYSNATFNFTPGVNAIVGHNGAGKSTVVEAIGFALFDAGKGSSLLRQGASGGQITVTIESTLDERRYDIVRRDKSAWYVHDAELRSRIVGGTDDVKAFLREHMGLARGADLERIFDDAVGVAQGALTAAFLRTPSQRKPVFDPLLGVDEYERAFSSLLESKNLIRDRREELSKVLARVEGVLEQLPVVVESLLGAAETVNQGESTLAGLETRLAAAIEERSAWEARRGALLRAQQAFREAQAANERALLLHQNALRALAEAKEAAQIVAANRAGHDAHLAHRVLRSTLEAEVEVGRRKQVERARLSAQLEQFQQALVRAESELARIEEVEATIPGLQKACEAERTLLLQLEAARALVQQRSALQTKATQLHESLRDESKRLDELRALAATGVNLHAELTDVNAEESRLAKAIESASRVMSANRARGETINEQNGALDGVNGALCPVCEQPLTAEHRVELHGRNARRLAELRSAWSQQSAEKKRLEEERTANSTRAATINTQIAHLPNAAAIEQAERWCAELSRQSAEHDALLGASSQDSGEIAGLEAKVRALGEPRVALAVATRAVETRAALLAAEVENTIAFDRVAADAAKLDEDLATLDASSVKLEEVRRAEAETQPAWQRVIEMQGAAAQLGTRESEALQADSAQQTKAAALLRAEESAVAAAANFDEAEAEAARQREAVAQVEAGTLRNTLAMQRSEIERLTRQQDALLKQQRELGMLKAKEDEIRRQQEVLDMMRTTLKQAGPLVTRAMIARISAYAAQWFGELTGDFARRLIWDEEYAILLEENGRKLEFKGMSGGEQMAAALSVRLALLRELGSIDIAFFDEPTAHLDAERREALAEQIKSVRGFRQLFVISHDDTFENKTDNVIKVERSSGVSRIVTG